jgi:hypothetical protein
MQLEIPRITATWERAQRRLESLLKVIGVLLMNGYSRQNEDGASTMRARSI